MKLKHIWMIALLSMVCLATHAQQERVWQWCVEIPSVISQETQAHPQAFLWISETCRQVKAVVVGQHNMCEETIFETPEFRQRMADGGLAIVWITPILDFPWDVNTGCNEALLKALEDLGEVSGYHELKYAPIVPLGHSAMATYPWNFGAWNPDRTLAIVSYHGDSPRTNLCGYGRANLEWGRNRNIDGIPGLMIEGEYEWWEARVNPSLAFRMMYPESCISFLCDAGRGHFDVAPRTADYIGLFLQKALEARLPANWNGTDFPKLKKLNPQDGWLAERWRTGTDKEQGEVRVARLLKQPRRAKPAPFAEYKGDKHDAFWYFDGEMATLTEAIYEQKHDLKPQFVSVIQEGKLAAYNSKSHVNVSARFLPQADGVTFCMTPVHTDILRATLSQEHGTSQPRISRVCGPIKQLNDTTFRVDFYRMGFDNVRRTSDVTLVAEAPGDANYKEHVQELNFSIPYPLVDGRRQSILWPSLTDVTQSVREIALSATTDSGLPVYYYVKQGPATISNDGKRVLLTDIPPRTKFPIKVTVVAWQYGIQGKWQTADPVERDFYITQ